MRVKLLSGAGGLLLFLVCAVASVLAGRHPAVREFLTEESVKAWVEQWGVWGPVAILAISAVIPFLFLPRWPVVFVAGALYGVTQGTVIGIAAGTLGAILHFELSRRLVKSLGERVRRRFGLPERMTDRQTFLVIFGLRAFPLTNYGLTNLLAGALNMRMGPFFLATFLGMIPSTAMYAAWGKLLRRPAVGHYVLAVGLVVFLVAGVWWLGRRLLPARPERSDADDDDLAGG